MTTDQKYILIDFAKEVCAVKNDKDKGGLGRIRYIITDGEKIQGIIIVGLQKDVENKMRVNMYAIMNSQRKMETKCILLFNGRKRNLQGA